MKSFILSFCAISLIIILQSCGNSKPAATNTVVADAPQTAASGGSELLYQSVWKLVEIAGKKIGSESKASMAFTPGQVNKVSGSTGCNRMNGSFELTGTDYIKFSPLATTRMACLDEIAGTTEKSFLDKLAKVERWSINSNMLSLKSGGNIVLLLEGQKPPSAEELALNGTWELNYISGAKIAFDGLFPDKKPTLIFDFPKPEASGNGGCNGYSSKVKVSGNKISFGDPLSTMMACEGNGEPVYFRTLKTVTSYNITNNTLTLIMGDIAVMRFTRK